MIAYQNLLILAIVLIIIGAVLMYVDFGLGGPSLYGIGHVFLIIGIIIFVIWIVLLVVSLVRH